MGELIVHDNRARRDEPAPLPAVAGPVTPMRLLEIATAQGADLAKLEQLMALQERWEKNEARKAYVAAMAAFKANPPTIVKNKHVAFSGTSYSHATHDEVTNKIIAALANYGLSHAWSSEQNGREIKVTCTITHELGHSESTWLTSAPDDSGKKNAIQQLASAITYLQRYTLLAITGLSTAEMRDADDDGRSAGVQQPVPERPEIPPDVRIALAEAAERGTQELKALFESLSPQTKNIVAKHHTVWWNALKAQAQGVQP